MIAVGAQAVGGGEVVGQGGGQGRGHRGREEVGAKAPVRLQGKAVLEGDVALRGAADVDQGHAEHELRVGVGLGIDYVLQGVAV